jgi:hypothetical protein
MTNVILVVVYQDTFYYDTDHYCRHVVKVFLGSKAEEQANNWIKLQPINRYEQYEIETLNEIVIAD